MNKKSDKFIPALKFRWLTPFFDFFLKWLMPESRFRQRLIEQAGIEKDYRILDIGCGTGTLIVMIKGLYPKTHVTGLDIDPEILETARTKAQKAGVEITFDQGSAFELPYPDGSFDRVFSSLMLHHLTTDNKRRALREAFRVLRPGGELHVADFGKPHNPLMFLISLVMRWFEEVADNIKGLLPEMIDSTGFTRVEETARYNTAFSAVYLYRAVKS